MRLQGGRPGALVWGGADTLPIYMLSYILFKGVHSLCLIRGLAALQ